MKYRLPLLSKAAKITFQLFDSVKYRAKKIFGFAAWHFSALNRILLNNSRDNDIRLLMVYDLSSQPFSIGDILLYQEVSLVLREKYKFDAIDFALVYNPKEPAVSSHAFCHIKEDNCLFHLASILSVAQVNPHLGSLFLFNSHAQLERFVIDNHDRYHVWPSASDYAAKKYMYYHIFNDLLHDYYQKHKALPFLKSRPNILSWAHNFLVDNVFPSVPVTVQLRRNRTNTFRNSHYDSWLEFFNYCKTRYPAKFIIICSASEVDERFKNNANVIIAKDYCTSVEQDLALVNVSAIHMGASSGPSTIAMFNANPFLMVNTDIEPNLYKGLIQEGNFVRFFFSSPLQNFMYGQETAELLIEEFTKMWTTLNI